MPPRKPTVERSRDILDGRSGFRLHADWGHVAVLEGGGHICELILDRVPGINPLWKPPWTTIDPDRYSPSRTRAYGPPPDGRLLAGIAGQSLSFDHFGPPSPEETAAGLATHGEAPCGRWKMRKDPAARVAKLHCSCVLRQAQIRFTRTISVNSTSPVVYCEERAENLGVYDRLISWNEHVTFGPPFLECGATLFDMPAIRAKTCGPGYSERIFLELDAEFVWPDAPRKDGRRSNMRTMPDETYGHYTTQLLDPALDIGFISACNPRLRLLVVYAFRRRDFPWVGNWEERNNRTAPPWRGMTFCRGMEFSTTPFAIPRRDTVDQGPLFGERTYRWLPARSTVTVRYMTMLFVTQEKFGGVSQVSIQSGHAVVTEAESGNRQLSVAIDKFL
jgi:hypothetical protein